MANKSQQAAITRMVALRQAGQSFRAIADTIKAKGVNALHAGVKKVVEANGMHRGGEYAHCQQTTMRE